MFIRRLKLDEFLERMMPRGQEAVRWSLSSLILVIARLLKPSSELEAHLKNRIGELFDPEYDFLLYDITSTYFEGQARFNLAQRGYSRDKRSDCKQVCIGLVVSRCGMPLGFSRGCPGQGLKRIATGPAVLGGRPWRRTTASALRAE